VVFILALVGGTLRVGETINFTRTEIYAAAGPRVGKIRPLVFLWIWIVLNECRSLTPHRYQLTRTVFSGIGNTVLLISIAWYLAWAVKIIVHHKNHEPKLVRYARNAIFMTTIGLLGYIKILVGF
jgi:hypothetical protein